MKPSLFIVAALVGGLSTSTTSATESGSVWYRVEVIVLTHEGGRPDAYPVTEVDDFRSLIDPLDRAVAAAMSPRDDASDDADDSNGANADGDDTDTGAAAYDPRQALETIAAITALEKPPSATSSEPGTVGPFWPRAYVNLPRLSPDMQAAWERLETSGQFEPRAWRAWHQLIGRDETSRPVRIHDRQVLRGDWLRTTAVPPAEPTDGAGIPPSSETGWRPAPEFRLDGSIRVYHSQFMHAASDLAWREPLEPDRRPLARDHLPPGLFQQHRLEQSRAIRPGRLEYFDSSWLGVLLKVTPLPGTEEPAAASDGDE
jgi:hypothetical protein